MKDRVVTAPLLPLLLVLFIGSGCSALIYEIVWSQLLELVIGASAISLGVLLATFMGGMCLGSLLFPRWVSSNRHPLRVYAVLEVGTAVFAILIYFGMPYVGAIYAAIGAFGFWGIVVRASICVVCLMPPTLLMGATLPAIARWVQTTPRGIAWLGFFYGGNIAGAVIGCVLAGFYLLRVYDMGVATYVAAAINAAVATGAFFISKSAEYSPVESDSKQAVSSPAGLRQVYVAIALSGMAALGAEVVWTRLLSMLFGASVYAFSIILAVFLTALGIGSSRAAALSRVSTNPRRDLGLCQALLIAAIAWSAYMTNSSLPYWPVNPTLTMSLWHNFQMDIFRCALAIVPAALLWGASFPLALAAAATKGQDPGRLVGGVYAANTIGGIAGAAAFSLVFAAGYGTQQAQQALIVISLAAALLVLAPTSVEKRSFVPAVMAVVFAGIFLATVPKLPGGFIAYGRFFANASYNLRKTKPEVIYSAEGVNAAVAVTQLSTGARNFHVAGKIEASTEPRDMKMQRMLGHLPALYNPEPHSVLVVGFGAGVTAGAFTLYPSVQRIVICEIEPLIPQAVASYFRKQNYDVLKDPRVQIVYDDARNFMRTTHEKFDVISYDSIHPWVKGAAALYTDEYFNLASRHLNPGGTISLWVPLYECSMEAAKSQIATFLKVFPSGTLWGNSLEGAGYDVVLMAKQGDPTIDLGKLAERLARPDHLNVKYSLDDVGVHSPVELAALYAGRGSDLAPWLTDAQINDDRSLRLQYLAGLSLNDYNQDAIYSAIMSYNKFPSDLFTGPNELRDAVRTQLKKMASKGT